MTDALRPSEYPREPVKPQGGVDDWTSSIVTPLRRDELEPTDGPYRILFVCTANICRSAYADLVANGAGLSRIQFSSAGTHALVGQSIDPPMAARLPAHIDASTHRARQLTRAIAENANLLVAMSERHREFILDEWPHLVQRTFLIGHVAREFTNMPTDTPLAEATNYLWTHRSMMRGDSIRDPYGRGDAAAAECAARIDVLLGDILGRVQPAEGRRPFP